MNFLNLEYFLAIADSGGVSIAAREKYVSQQSVSDHLKRLEAHYETPLFYRTAPLTLTSAGEKLYAAAKELLRICEQTEIDIKTANRIEAGRLVIGLVFEETPPFLAELIAMFNKRYKAGRISMQVRRNCNIRAVIPPDVELLITPGPADDRFHCIPLLKDRMAVVTSSRLMDRIYGGRREAVQREALDKGDPELLRELPFAVYSDASDAGTLPAFRVNELAEKAVMDTNGGDLLISMCKTAQCAVLKPLDYAFRSFSAQDDVLFFPIKSVHPAPTLSILYRRRHPLSRAAACFTETAKDFFSDKQMPSRGL
jgi:DNA-binding transcriptional LysR family regulator